MNRLPSLVRRACMPAFAAACLSWGPPAPAATTCRTVDGQACVSGGVSQEELASLHQRRHDYSLWVITAALKTGAYLADVEVVVRDDRQREVLRHRMDGPWLFVNLAPGRYAVEASLGGRVQRRTTTIHPGDHHQVFVYFDTGDQVSPERPDDAGRNPYDGTPKPR